MSCDGLDRAILQMHRLDRFQSLSGFLMSCDSLPSYCRPSRAWFQSLSGFLMSCDRKTNPYPHTTSHCVSIPIGFSDEL